MPTPRKFDQLLTFVDLYQQAKSQFILSVHSSDTVTKNSKNFQLPLNFREFVTGHKKSANSICSFLRYGQL